MFKRKWWCKLVLLLVVNFCLGANLVYAGIKVSPAAFCAQNIEPGKDLQLGVDLIVTNESNVEKVFLIKSVKPSEAVNKWIKGYTEIPDPAWFRVAEERITVAAGAEIKLPMSLNIPNEEKYFNQHWMVYLDITTEEKGPMAFRIALAPNYMIETRIKNDITEKPYGVLGIVPATVKSEAADSSKERGVSFKIYNNDTVEHKYSLVTYIPNASAQKQDISVSPGYEFIKNISWVRPIKAKIKVAAGESSEVMLNVIVPKKVKALDKGWEAIVYVEPDSGPAGFVRVLIE